MIPLNQREELARYFVLGAKAKDAAVALGINARAVRAYYHRFRRSGVDAVVRRPKVTPELGDRPYTGPEWIGAAIGDPQITEGLGWIGKRIEPQSQP